MNHKKIEIVYLHDNHMKKKERRKIIENKLVNKKKKRRKKEYVLGYYREKVKLTRDKEINEKKDTGKEVNEEFSGNA